MSTFDFKYLQQTMDGIELFQQQEKKIEDETKSISQKEDFQNTFETLLKIRKDLLTRLYELRGAYKQSDPEVSKNKIRNKISEHQNAIVLAQSQIRKRQKRILDLNKIQNLQDGIEKFFLKITKVENKQKTETRLSTIAKQDEKRIKRMKDLAVREKANQIN